MDFVGSFVGYHDVFNAYGVGTVSTNVDVCKVN